MKDFSTLSLSNKQSINSTDNNYRSGSQFFIYNNLIKAKMLTEISPKLPMRNKAVTKDYYINKLGFQIYGDNDFDGYLMVQKDNIQIHFFDFKDLDPQKNYGQIYIRTNDIDKLYQTLLDNRVPIHPNGHLETKPWGQKEFALLDPDNNLLTFGQSVK